MGGVKLDTLLPTELFQSCTSLYSLIYTHTPVDTEYESTSLDVTQLFPATVLLDLTVTTIRTYNSRRNGMFLVKKFTGSCKSLLLLSYWPGKVLDSTETRPEIDLRDHLSWHNLDLKIEIKEEILCKK